MEWKRSSATDDVGGVLCAEEESALDVVVEVFAGKANAIRACAGEV